MKYAKKSLGQNFLVDKNLIKKIVDIEKIEGRNIIEIGPGQGAMTDEILKRKPKSLSIIEKDFTLEKNLREKYKKYKFVYSFNKDILKFNLEKLCVKNNTIIYGNLPYNISSQILVKILKFKVWPPKFDSLILMFQKELGDKIIGKFPSKNYGRLSILSNFRLNVINKFKISPNCFIPKPKVTSMLIHFKPKKNIFEIKKIENLERITNIFFSNKRKMINKNIKKIINYQKILNIPGLKMTLRPSEIKPEIYYRITEILERK
tara:strand:+ start:887 stop:1672 length:786 start_codon:yes stop_codon:yes gene_type:complete